MNWLVRVKYIYLKEHDTHTHTHTNTHTHTHAHTNTHTHIHTHTHTYTHAHTHVADPSFTSLAVYVPDYDTIDEAEDVPPKQRKHFLEFRQKTLDGGFDEECKNQLGSLIIRSHERWLHSFASCLNTIQFRWFFESIPLLLFYII